MYAVIMMDSSHYTLSRPIHCKTPRMNTNVNYRLWIIMMHQWSLINYKKCTTLVGSIDDGEGYVYVRSRTIWKISISSSFCYELKSVLKMFFNFKMSIINIHKFLVYPFIHQIFIECILYAKNSWHWGYNH